MQNYLDLLRDVRTNGVFRADRTGVGAYGVFGRQLRFDLAKGFPLLTTKKLFTRGIIAELLWILSGDTNEHTLRDQGVNIWKEWAAEDGSLGRVYGNQWRDWHSVKWADPLSIEERLKLFSTGVYGAADHLQVGELELNELGVPAFRQVQLKYVDQIANLIADLKTNPNSRRHIVTAWNPGELGQMALPPCHCLFQFYTEALSVDERLGVRPDLTAAYYAEFGSGKDLSRAEERGSAILDDADVPRYKLSCQLYQRSADIFLGVPFNIASYSLLTMMVAQCVSMVPGEFIHTYGELHIYANHLEQVDLQLTREPKAPPVMKINPAVKDILGFKLEDFTLTDYSFHPVIKAEVAV